MRSQNVAQVERAISVAAGGLLAAAGMKKRGVTGAALALVGAALARRDPSLASVLDDVLARDEAWRAATTSAERMRAEQRERSESIAAAKRAGEDAEGALALLLVMWRIRHFEERVGVLKRADQALYRAKRDGRNRVVPDAA